jgi:3'-5' exoribonuclease
VSTIADLAENRVVEGTYAVAKKERRRTRAGSDYLALQLVDPSGKIEARVWSDVELLDARFSEGDAVHVLGRVDKYRDRLQLDVRTLEPAEGQDAAELTPTLRRDADELDGFLEFRGGEISHAGLKTLVGRFLADDRFRSRLRELPASPEAHHTYAGGLLEHTVAVATLCHETAQVHPRLRADLLVAAAILHDAGRTLELGRGPSFRPTEEGRLLGHVQLGVRLIESQAGGLERGVLAEVVHAVAVHHEGRAARTAEAAVLYHANQLDAAAATRPIPD